MILNIVVCSPWLSTSIETRTMSEVSPAPSNFLNIDSVSRFSSKKGDDALLHLLVEPFETQTVHQWAERSCMSESSLRKVIRNRFQMSPKKLMNQVRYELVLGMVHHEGWEANSDFIAVITGIGKDSKALHKFLSRNFNTTFTKLKSDCLNSDAMCKCRWFSRDELSELIRKKQEK